VLSLNPPVEYYSIDNRVRTVAAGAERRIHVERVPGSLDLRVWGDHSAARPRQDMLLGIEDPALYAAKAFRQLLEQRGIAVAGRPVARHLYPHDVPDMTAGAGPSARRTGAELARHTSAPFLEDLRITDKVSQNLHAEMALRAVARARRNIGSFEAGREEMRLSWRGGSRRRRLQSARRLGAVAARPGDARRGGQAAAVHVPLACPRELDFAAAGGRARTAR
jgi:serine-type D-Ala-D-Ala carboxypeptidase/endopeptidase (penicillin-binding protein 4)